MTSPGKTSSGSWMWGLCSTMKGSPHLAPIVCRVSPSPTTYTCSHGRCANAPRRSAASEPSGRRPSSSSNRRTSSGPQHQQAPFVDLLAGSVVRMVGCGRSRRWLGRRGGGGEFGDVVKPSSEAPFHIGTVRRTWVNGGGGILSG